MVLTTALDNNKIFLVLVGIITSVVGAVYYLTVIKTIYFDESEYVNNFDYRQTKEIPAISLSNAYSISISILNLLIIAFILTPNELLNLCNLLSVVNFS